MTTELDEIWQDFETYRSQQESSNTYVLKEFQTCSCGIPTVIATDNLPVCTGCGLVHTVHFDNSPEWTNGVSESGVSTEVARCGNQAVDPELYSAHWGTGTIISAS